MVSDVHATPFDRTAIGYDVEFTDTAVGRMQRQRTWRWFKHWSAKQGKTNLQILELNGGSGEDCKWLVSEGHAVTYSDASKIMVQMAMKKVKGQIAGFIHSDIQHIHEPLAGKQFDLIWSNFGGVNCVSPEEIKAAGTQLASLLNPGGSLVMVVMGRFCLWETLYFLAKFKWKTAFRRWSRKPILARLADGVYQPTWYYSAREIRKLLPDFKVEETMPVGLWLPPSYLDPMFQGNPRLLQLFDRWEWSAKNGHRLADHYLIHLVKK